MLEDILLYAYLLYNIRRQKAIVRSGYSPFPHCSRTMMEESSESTLNVGSCIIPFQSAKRNGCTLLKPRSNLAGLCWVQFKFLGDLGLSSKPQSSGAFCYPGI